MIKVNKIIQKMPEPLGRAVGHICLAIYRKIAEARIIKDYSDSEDIEIHNIVQYIKAHGMRVLNYEFDIEKKNWRDIKVYRDEDSLPYVMHLGKKLYYRREASNKEVACAYIEILNEQDKKSPHCYVQNESRQPERDCIIAEIGAAGGSFTLEWIEQCKKAYLFECSPDWIDALKKTFEPWSDKVEIVNRYVGNKTENDFIKLDDYFRDRDVTLIKADIEGAELDMLDGARLTLENKVRQLYLCTYHRWDHEYVIKENISKLGFDTEYNQGYILMWKSPSDFERNIFRHAVVYGSK